MCGLKLFEGALCKVGGETTGVNFPAYAPDIHRVKNFFPVCLDYEISHLTLPRSVPMGEVKSKIPSLTKGDLTKLLSK
jgi:hypothetical protein